MVTRVTILFVMLAAIACGSAGSNGNDWSLTLVNNGNVDLVPFPVVTTPPPPHREPDPGGTIVHTGFVVIDVKGFNPLYYHQGSKRGFVIQLALDDTPPAILLRLFQYQVPPGQEGSDPALQPTLIAEKLFEPTLKTLVLTVGRPNDMFPATLDES